MGSKIILYSVNLTGAVSQICATSHCVKQCCFHTQQMLTNPSPVVGLLVTLSSEYAAPGYGSDTEQHFPSHAATDAGP